eukprot:CAMPEP_0170056732 /NCGR_PEP_ID=MMETSP0019_2-20121128/27_1 /TAXON_ID=98059 /ORGANISM="Dinobryon sp., Strain UTEXLB2267" /LENGTH=587 /DNA_ID=CAMNT_0010261311 /DNA_START=16 /DNA_END=1779 /DNA_ORIENTATION=+
MTAVKVYFQEETRRLQLDDSDLNFKSLFRAIENIFPSLNGNFCIKWKDEEGDLISFTSDVEFAEAVRIMSDVSDSLLRFHIQEATVSAKVSEKNIPSNRLTKENLTCDKCGCALLNGKVLLCIIRDDMQLCQECEASLHTKNDSNLMSKLYHQPSPFASHYSLPDQISDFAYQNAQPAESTFIQELEEVDTLVGDQLDVAHADAVYLQDTQKFPQVEQKEFEEESPMRRRKPVSHNSSNNTMKETHEDDAENVSMADIYPTAIKLNTNNTSIITATKDCDIVSNKETFAPSTSIIANTAGTPTDFSHLKASDSSDSILPPPVPDLDLSFVCHVTYPEGSQLSPLMVFNKMWRLRNSGSCAWPAGCSLAQYSGDAIAMDIYNNQWVPQLSPGQEYSLSLSLKAPAVANRYMAYFRMQYYGSGNQLQWFGERLCVDIIVAQPVHLPSYCHYYGDVQHQQCKQQEDQLRQAMFKQDTAMTLSELSDFEFAKKLAEEWDLEQREEDIVFKCPKEFPMQEMAVIPTTTAVNSSAVATSTPAPTKDKWARELAQLSEMGFTDNVIPLLELHLQENDDPVAGMELVVSLLLARP